MPDTRLLANRYRVGELLGSGGMAEVRRGRDTLLARDVAIKLFQPGHDPADAQRFDNEIRTLARLSHPGLVAVYDADPDGETPYMVLELVEGRTLRGRLADGPMSVEDVRRLGAALADALAHVHAHGFVHRDVKPSNILLGADDVPRLADFGLARLTDSARLTRADQVVGTAAYLAPEQVRGAEITPAVDVYALGLVLLECLTGRREYEGAEIEGEVGIAGERAALGMQVPELEAPPGGLTTGMFAGDAIEPALDAAGKPEVVRVDGEHEAAVDDALIEPFGQYEFHALDATAVRHELLPFVDP